MMEYRVQIDDGNGQPIDGNRDGTPGGIAVAILSGKGATIAAVTATASPAPARLLGAMVDVLAENDGLLDVLPHHRRGERS